MKNELMDAIYALIFTIYILFFLFFCVMATYNIATMFVMAWKNITS